MSYNSDDDMHLLVGPSRPRFTGWLTMAPDVEPASSPKASATATAPAAAESGVYSPTRHAPSTHGFAMTAQAMPISKQQRRGATFQIGSPDLISGSPTGSVGSQNSARSDASDDSDSPLFDVRASFAPMPAYGKAKSGPPKLNGGGGMQYGGLEWKGKTVHAVEQEMEQLGDHSLLSHAPDAAYLASRLEGLKRNLEIEAFQPRWVGDDHDDSDHGAHASPHLASGGRARPVDILAPGTAQRLNLDAAMLRSEDQEMACALENLPPLSHGASAPMSNASSVSLVDGPDADDLTLDYGFTFDDDDDDDKEASTAKAAAGATLPEAVAVEVVTDDAPQLPELSAPLDPVAKAAALDARIEIRTLRRADLEEVRELHAYHGDADRSPDQPDNYTTTASFLLRLLVDDRHVCLVAVSKPLPTPLDPLPTASELERVRCGAPGASAANLRLGVSPGSHGSPYSSSLDSGRQTPTDSLFSTTPLGTAPITEATSITDGEACLPSSTSASTTMELVGPTETLAPSVVRRVMAAPPPRGTTSASDTIVGVISAQLSLLQAPTEMDLWSQDTKMRQALLDAPNADADTDAALAPRADVEAHLLTLAVAPSERSQGVGAKLLDCLSRECKERAQTLRRPTASSPLSAGAGTGAGAMRGKREMTVRMYLEVYPTNTHALQLYACRGFQRPPGQRGTKKGFYRGDARIPIQQRLKKGGTDAWVLEKVL
ncbi:hypothetical protein ACQY0O_002237 [Thecaphora frezii]